MKKLLLGACLFAGMHLSAFGQYTIYPIPQKVTTQGGTIQLTQNINVVCESDVWQVTRNRLEEVIENAGLTCTFSNAASTTQTNLYVGRSGSGAIADKYATDHSIAKTVFEPAANRFDPYVLQINGNSANGDIVVLGNNDGSAYYAFATLEQILEQAGGGTLQQVTYEDYAHCQWRGVIEGFYGHPYTVDAHCSLFQFFKRFKLNIFVYAPKMDPYHLGYWREDYPTEITERQRYLGWITQDDVRRLATTARECNVHFVWAAHPGLAHDGQTGIDFSSTTKIDQGVEELMAKYHHMYDLGVRAFCVSIDDMASEPSGDKQAYLPDRVQQRLKEEFTSQAEGEKIAPLFYVPATYALMYSAASRYMPQMASIDSDVVLSFTGDSVCGGLKKSDCDKIAGYIQRNPLIWWNATVNDNNDDRIYMRELTAHYKIVPATGAISTLGGVILNPMKQSQPSKVGIFGLADYCWNPGQYNVTKNWSDCFDYLALPGDTETAQKLKFFARYSDAIYEDAEIIALYNGFKAKYSEGNFPAEGAKIREEMTQLKATCEYIETVMANHTDSDYRLFATDVRAWNAKLKTYADIILRSLNLMENGATMNRPEAWEIFAEIITLYTGLGTEPQYFIDELEGYGTGSHEVSYEVHPANTYTRPFVDYLYETLGANTPGDWPAPEEPQMITNIPEADRAALAFNEATLEISGLNNFTLGGGQYVGIYLASLEKVNLSDLTLPAGIELQTSTSGKIWDAAELPLVEAPAAYLRLINTTENGIVLNIGTFSTSATVEAVNPGTPTPSTNMGTYQTYSINNIVDGNTGTFYWSDDEPVVGSYIQLAYNNVYTITSVKLVFRASDQLTGSANIEVSTDGTNWTKVGEYNNTLLASDYSFTCNTGGVKARYVRFYVTEELTGTNWLQLAEFSCVIPGATTTVTQSRPTVTTSLNAYQSYSTSNLTDGNTGSYFWSNGEPRAGDWIQLEYAQAQSIFDITIVFMDNDQLVGSGDLQVSTDGTNWTKVATYDSGKIGANNTFTTNANGATGKYLRLYITNVIGSYWLKMAEFSCVMADRLTQTTDHNAAKISALSDKNLITNYTALSAGYLEHSFIENLDITAVEIYHNTDFDAAYELPTVSVFNGTEWQDAGTLERLATVIDTREMEMVTAVRIEWNEHNIPNLYEIIPAGAYTPPAASAVESPLESNNGVNIYAHHGQLVVSADRALSRVVVYDLYGRTVRQVATDANRVTIYLGANPTAIMVVQVVDAEGNITTGKVINR